MNTLVNFVFPAGCLEAYREATLPCVPRVGEYIQGSQPQSGCYRVVEVRYNIPDPADSVKPDFPGVSRCDEVTIVLEATDSINFKSGK